MNRKGVRAAALDLTCASSIAIKCADGKTRNIPLDTQTTRAVLNAIDLDLSNRLSKLGVSEL